MGYPINYRRGRSPQRARAGTPVSDFPWIGAGVLAGGAAFLHYGGQLIQSVAGINWGYPSPAAYGWTLVVNCPARAPTRWIGGAGIVACTTNVIANTTWYAQPNPASINRYLWDDRQARRNIPLMRFENVHAAQHWRRDLGLAMPGVVSYPLRVGGVLPVAVPRRAYPGLSVRAYAPPEEGFIGYPGNPFLGARWGRWDLFSRDIHDAGGVTHPPRPVVVPRAIPYPGTKEIKVNVNTPAGRAFFGILSAFNFMGDAWGLTRAIWRALPKHRRGRSTNLGHMLNDIWRGLDEFDTTDGFLHAVLNASLWKFQDTVMGGTQASIFDAQMRTYGPDSARAWAMLDTQIRASTTNVERMAAQPRSETSTAY